MAAKIGPSPSSAGAAQLPRTFLDSNILIYAEDAAYPEKQQKAIDLIVSHGRQRSGVLSVQVLGEYFYAASRKLHLDPALARAQVEFYSRFRVVEPTADDVLAAIDLHRLHGFSYWDALIVRCAGRSGCTVLLSEDMQNGRQINGVRIVNPFL
jgi:predicted nucleic acid-binding protein